MAKIWMIVLVSVECSEIKQNKKTKVANLNKFITPSVGRVVRRLFRVWTSGND